MSWLFTRPPSNTELATVTFRARTHRFAPLVNRLFLITLPALVTVTSWLTTASTVFGLQPVVRALGKEEVGAGGRVTGWQAKARSAPRTGSASRRRARRAGAEAVRNRDTGRLLGGGAGPLAAAAPAAAGATDGARRHGDGPGGGEV